MLSYSPGTGRSDTTGIRSHGGWKWRTPADGPAVRNVNPADRCETAVPHVAAGEPEVRKALAAARDPFEEVQWPFGECKAAGCGDCEMAGEGLNFSAQTKTVFTNHSGSGARATTRQGAAR